MAAQHVQGCPRYEVGICREGNFFRAFAFVGDDAVEGCLGLGAGCDVDADLEPDGEGEPDYVEAGADIGGGAGYLWWGLDIGLVRRAGRWIVLIVIIVKVLGCGRVGNWRVLSRKRGSLEALNPSALQTRLVGLPNIGRSNFEHTSHDSCISGMRISRASLRITA